MGYVLSEREEIDQDIRAMRYARTWEAVEGTRRAMEALGRWTEEAQRVYTRLKATWRQ